MSTDTFYRFPRTESKTTAKSPNCGQNLDRTWAFEYRECIGDDLEVEKLVPFPRLADVKPGEIVVFSYITFESRESRDLVNGKAMQDPRMTEFIDVKNLPFDSERIAYGGFKVLVAVNPRQ